MLKFVPVIVTVSPTAALVGEKEVMLGGGVTTVYDVDEVILPPGVTTVN